MIKKIFITTLLICLLNACTGHREVNDVLDVPINKVADEIQIPKAILSQIEEEALSESKTIAPVYSFVPLQVKLTELSSDVLKKPAVKYNFPKGGGHIDLADVVVGEGSFFLSFPDQQFESIPEIMHLFYVSNSPIRNIEKENYGLGCGKMIDLKSSFSKLQKENYLKLNTNALRYLHVLSGHYIFVFKKSSQIYLTQLTITDSRHSKELCIDQELK